MEIVKDIYLVTKEFPSHEQYGLVSQIRRAAVSIPSNIAEGSSRKTNPDFARFLELAIGSAFELETQLIIAKDLNYLNAEKADNLIKNINFLQKQINTLKIKVRS